VVTSQCPGYRICTTMPAPQQIIHIQPDAPRKPAPGAPCNGCGVCCLAEPCPLGVLLSGRRTGACAALQWQPSGLYRCGAIAQPQVALRHALPPALHGSIPVLAWGLGRLAKRWVAAGAGCDSTLTVVAPDGPAPGAKMPHD
jgi:hypothetical protein